MMENEKLDGGSNGCTLRARVKKKTDVYSIWRCSQPKIKSRSLHKPHWCARPRPDDGESASIIIFACSILHYKIEHQNMLLLGP